MQKNPKRFVPVALILITASFLFGVFQAGLFWIKQQDRYLYEYLVMPRPNSVFHPAIVLLVLGFLFIIWYTTRRVSS